MAGNVGAENVKNYIVEQIGTCKILECPAIKQHILRRRETDQTHEQDDADEKDDLKEIIKSTLNALHTYIMHDTKHLHRLMRRNRTTTINKHFVSSIADTLKQDEENKETKENKNKTVIRINFGESVLTWFKLGEEPNNVTFREAIVLNPQSTINHKLFLSFTRECYFKLVNAKTQQFLLNEMLSLKLYTDTNDYQSSLRRAHWRSASNKQRQDFYIWALQLYLTSLFHSKIISRWEIDSTVPLQLYYGLNKVFILNNSIPKYNGPTSTTTVESVAQQFSNGVGVIWTIKPSFNNKYKCCLGIAVGWISQHPNEAEILLIDQYLPIRSARKFNTDDDNNTDHLLFTLKEYKKRILNRGLFENILGFKITQLMIDIVKQHPIIYERVNVSAFESKITVLSRLVDELQIDDKQLKQRHMALSSQVQWTDYEIFNFKLLKLYNEDEIKEHLVEFEHNEYKINFTHNNTENAIDFSYDANVILTKKKVSSCKIFIKNESLFGKVIRKDGYILLHDINNSSLFATKANMFYDGLQAHNQFVIQLQNCSQKSQNQKHITRILEAKYTLIWNQNATTIESKKIINGNHYIYNYENVDSIQMLIPYHDTNPMDNADKISLYVQPKAHMDFVLFKEFDIDQEEKISQVEFDIDQEEKISQVEFCLKILDLEENYDAQFAKDFFSKINIEWNKKFVPHMNYLIATSPKNKKIKQKVLNRLVNVLNISAFADLLNILQSDFISHEVFNYLTFNSTIRGKSDDPYRISITQFKMLKYDCSLYSFGDGANGKLGVEDYDNRKCSKPTCITHLSHDNCLEISSYNEHSLCIDSDGNVYSYGKNCKGQLGTGDMKNMNIPYLLKPFSKYKAIKVAVGSNHSLILTENGKVWSFGDGAKGQLGHGDLSSITLPKLIQYFQHDNIVHISCGSNHCCAITIKHKLYSWGNNENGQCGVGQQVLVYHPTSIRLPSYQLYPSYSTCGEYHTLVLTTNGIVLSCGYDIFGNLGHGSTETKREYTLRVIESLGSTFIDDISAGHYHNLCVSENGMVYSFGRGREGQLGHGNTTKQTTPKVIQYFEQKNIKIVSCKCGSSHSAAISTKGELFMWGKGNDGELGDEISWKQNPIPIEVRQFKDVVSEKVALGRSCSFVIAEKMDSELKENVNDSKIIPYNQQVNFPKKSYKIYIQNQLLFNTEKWIFLSREFQGYASTFVCSLMWRDDKICSNLPIKHYKEFEILQATYLLCVSKNEEKLFEIKEDEINNNVHTLYEFNDLDEIEFIVPSSAKKSHSSTIQIYVKPKHLNTFIFLKEYKMEPKINSKKKRKYLFF
eukprot:256739_1